MKLGLGQNMVKRQSYRLRVYQSADGSLDIVFNEGEVPADTTAKKIIDHDVTDTQTWVEHIEPPLA